MTPLILSSLSVTHIHGATFPIYGSAVPLGRITLEVLVRRLRSMRVVTMSKTTTQTLHNLVSSSLWHRSDVHETPVPLD